jgi:hypothetical protein
LDREKALRLMVINYNESASSRPSVQPKSASACLNAERLSFITGSVSSPNVSTPMRRTRSLCCAHAATGIPPLHPSCLRGAATPAAYRGKRCMSGLEVKVSKTFFAPREAGFVQVFGCRDADPIHARRRPASEKRQGTKSRWVGRRRCRGLYGELSGALGSKRMTRSGRAHGFGRRRGCACRAERADRGVVDRECAGDAGQSDGPAQAGAVPVEIRREWLVSLRWRIGGDGIMRCRS